MGQIHKRNLNIVNMNDWKSLLANQFAEELKNIEPEEAVQSSSTSPAPTPQSKPLRVEYQKSGRKGKPVTLVTDFFGDGDELQRLTKLLQKKLGTGGSHCFNSDEPFDGQILLQGDQRQKVVAILQAEGYKTKLCN